MLARVTAAPETALQPYAPRLAAEWLLTSPQDAHRTVEGTLAFVDISGFTRLTERLARVGRVGAEELNDILDATFGELLEDARAEGADLVKWGGDAVLLLFRGAEHACHAVRAAHRMRDTLRRVGKGSATAGRVTLRMSVGIASGRFDFFLVGDPDLHRELVIAGPGASLTAEMESIAKADQIVVSDATAQLLPRRCLGDAVDGGRLIRSRPPADEVPVDLPAATDVSGLLSRPVREHLLASRGSSEHRPLAVAFIEFRGIDAVLAEGARAAVSALDDCVRNVQSACDEHDVSFLESDIGKDGGKFMLAGGAPQSRGQDGDRLLRAVRLAVSRAGRLTLRAGVNHGRVFAGDFGPPFRRTYSIKGDAVNTAARVMAHAAPGQVLATTDVMARARTRFATSPVPPFRVKGKAEPLQAVAIGAPETAEPLIAAPGDGAFVGRETELAALRTALDRARGRRGTVVEVIGEPGMGKSTLIDRLLQEASDFVVLRAPSSSYESRTPYYPFRALLRDVLGIRAADSPDRILQRLLDRVALNASSLIAWLPLLGAVLDVPLPPSRETSDLDPQFRRARLEEVVVDFLNVVVPTPALLVFDNTHLTDDASAGLLARIETVIVDRPWVLVAARRDVPTGYAAAGRNPAQVSMRLAPICGDDAILLLDAISGSTPLSPHALRAIADKADGNPLFLRALLGAASRAGTVADLPDSVEEVLTGELDRLPPGDRTLLRYASVLGMRFSESLLQDMLGSETGPDLSRLSDFVQPDPDGGWRFSHALARDAAYAGLPFKARRSLHERAGQAIEAAAEDPGEVAELLSMHFSQAGDHERSWRYSRAAGDSARARYAYSSAIEFYERALSSGSSASAPAGELADVYEALGDVCDVAGLSHDAIDAYRRSGRLRRDDQLAHAGVLLKEAALQQRVGAAEKSLRLLSRGRRTLRDVPGADAQAARSRLAARYGFGKYLRAEPRSAMRWSAIALREAAESADLDAQAYAYTITHLAHLRAGIVEKLPYGEMAAEVYRQTGNLRMQAHSLNNLALGAVEDDRWSSAAEQFAGAVEIFHRIGDTANEANAQYNRAQVLIWQRRFEDAQQLLAAAERAALASDDGELVALIARESGRALAGQGQFELAQASFGAARALLTNLGLNSELIQLDEAIAECMALSGDPDLALSTVHAAIEQAEQLGLTGHLAALYRVRGSALRLSGRFVEARQSLETGLQYKPDEGGRRQRALILLELSRLDGAVPPPERAQLESEATLILEQLGVLVSPV